MSEHKGQSNSYMQDGIWDNPYFLAPYWLKLDSDCGFRSSGPVILSLIVENAHAGHYTLQVSPRHVDLTNRK